MIAGIFFLYDIEMHALIDPGSLIHISVSNMCLIECHK